MDLSAEVDRAAEELEWGDLASTLRAALCSLLAETPTTPPPQTSPPPPVPAELNADLQPSFGQDGAHGGYTPLGADPFMMAAPTINQAPLHPDDFLQPDQLYSQGEAYAYSQGQYLPYQWPEADMVTAAAVSDPAAPLYPYEDLPVFTLHGGVEQNLGPITLLDGDMAYEKPAEFIVPPNSKKRKRPSQQGNHGPYIKKPPNAFMLYMKEQRPNVESDIKNKGNAAVNVVLGQRWKSLTQEEKAKYNEQANNEKLLHAQKHPGWSNKENYGKKRKRENSREPPTMAKASSSTTEEDCRQTKKLCLTQLDTAIIKATTHMMEPHPVQTVPTHTQTAPNTPVWDMYHQPQVPEVGPTSWPASPSLVFPVLPPQVPKTEHQRRTFENCWRS